MWFLFLSQVFLPWAWQCHLTASCPPCPEASYPRFGTLWNPLFPANIFYACFRNCPVASCVKKKTHPVNITFCIKWFLWEICTMYTITKTSCIFAMSGKSPGLIWCSRCSCEYLEICFFLDQNNLLKCWSCSWKNHGKVFLACTVSNTCSNFYQVYSRYWGDFIVNAYLLSRVQLTMHPDPWWAPFASSPSQTRWACPSSSWKWCRRAPDRKVFGWSWISRILLTSNRSWFYLKVFGKPYKRLCSIPLLTAPSW